MANTFKTNDLALFGFLALNGLQYVDKEVVTVGNNTVIYFVFEDENNKGKRLEFDFASSEFKRYRDLTLFARTEIEKAKKKAFGK